MIKKVKTVQGKTSHNYYLPKSYEEDLKENLTERMYRQECLAEILDDNLYALFQMSDIIDCRRDKDLVNMEDIRTFVIGVDPAVTATEDSDLTGIVVVGQDYEGVNYVFEDASQQQASPEKWAGKVINLFEKYNKFSGSVRIVAERNQGGDMVSTVIKNAARSKLDTPVPPVKLVVATRGKAVRAEPIAAIYERHEVHHIGEHRELEFEMTEWNPTDKNAKSPDRLDALVWAMTALTKNGSAMIKSGYGGKSKDDRAWEEKAPNPYCGYR